MMLLDEPTAGMAHEDVERIAALIRRVAANRTVLMVEHNLSVVSTLSDHITVLARGEILAQGDYASVSKNAATWSRPISGTGACLRPTGRCSACATCMRGTASRTSCTGVDFDVAPRRGGHAARPQRRGQDRRRSSRSWASSTQRQGSVQLRRHGDRSSCRRTGSPGWASRYLPRGARHLLEPQRRGEPAAAAAGAARAGCRSSRSSSSSRTCSERLREPGHQALGRRAADARDRAHPAHRRAPAAARRADRGPGAGDRPADRPHDRASSRQKGFTILLVEQNFRFAATVADRHYVMEHGRVVDMIPERRRSRRT